MEVLETRIASFKKQKRVKNPAKPSSSVSVKWPHPSNFLATPSILAEAGFYYNPSYEDRDNVTCYICEKQLSDWEERDDPFDIHWEKCGPTCCWASLRCGLRGDMDHNGSFVFPNKNRIPTSKSMERARLETFSVGDGWIHDQEQNHGANSRKMAYAGFVYTPEHAGDDLATCLYCKVSLSGWDASDDPMAEHRKRGEKIGYTCPFLLALDSITTATMKPSSRSNSQARSKPSSKPSKAAHKDITIPTKTHDGDLNDVSESEASSIPLSSKRATRGRSTSGSVRSASGSSRSASGTTAASKKHTRSQSRVGLGDVTEDVEAEVNNKAVATTATTSSNKIKSRPRSVSRTIAEKEKEEKAMTRTSSRNKAKAKEEVEVEEGTNESVKPKKSTRGRPKSKVAPPAETSDDALLEGEGEMEDVVELKKSTLGRPKAKALARDIEETDDGQEGIATRKPSRAKSKVQALPDAKDVETEVEARIKPSSRIRTKPSVPVPRKPSRTKPKPTTIEQDEDENPPPQTERKEPTASTSSTKLTSNTKVQSVSISKAQAPEPEDEGDGADVFMSPPSSPPPLSPSPSPILVEQVETKKPPEAGLHIPKRIVKGKGKPSVATDGAEKGQRDASTKGERAIGTGNQTGDKEVVEDDAPISQPLREPQSLASTSSQTAPPVKRTAKTKQPGNEQKGMKVVEISTDEEGENAGTKLEEEKPHTKPNSNKMQMFVEIVQLPRAVQPPPPPLSRTRIPPPTESNTQVSEDEMAGIEDDLRSEGGYPIQQTQEDEPKTPPRPSPTRNTPQLPHEETSSDPSAPILPPLSKLPFMPLQSLTDAELDMSVEEWIRYQMEVEYDKFRRDGERELWRFRKRAEEVRKIIEGL